METKNLDLGLSHMSSPHSLGTLIEWKQKDQTKSRIYLVPNKWGLNSCLSLSTHQFIQCSLFPVP